MNTLLRMTALIALIIHCSIGTVFSQTSAVKCVVTGNVIDSATNKGLEYATVALTGADNQVINMMASDGNGKFSLAVKQAGEFTVTVTTLGYNEFSSKIKVDNSSTKIDLGTIGLRSGVQIKEVTVAAFKPLIKSDVDKLTYSVEADPEAKTSTLVEILRKVPQLTVDAEDNVTLNGQSNYKILVNGKSSSMYSNNFKDIIRSMPANSIKDIEVITNPSTKYESEGIGGIINIITNRKNSANGYNGRISAGAGSFDSYNTNAYIAAQMGKLNLSASYWYGRNGSPENTSMSNRINKLSPDRMYNNSEGSNTGHGNSQNISVEASYEIDSLNLITLEMWGYDASYSSKGLTTTNIYNEDYIKTQEFTNITRGKSSYGSLSGSLNYQKLFKKPERSFTVSYKLDNNPNKSDYSNDIDGILDYPTYRQKSWNKASGSEHTLQLDYYDPLTKMHQIEFGVKYILRLNISDSEVQNWDDPNWVVDNSRKNDLDYTQHIFGAYGGYVFKLNKFSAKTGFRLEGTVNDGLVKAPTPDKNVTFDNKFANIVPYLNLSYQIKPSQTARLSYTQRLQRPGIWHLNPYVNDSDPLNISFGNPNLKAVVSHSIAGNYSIFNPKWNIYIGLFSNFANNSIINITTVNDKGVSQRTFDNIGKNQNYGLNGSYSYRLGVKFNVYVNGNVNYSVIESKKMGLRNEGFNYGGSLGMGVGLWKDANFRVNGGVYSSSVNLQGRGSTYYYSGAGLSQQLFKKKLDINISVSNPFTKYQGSNSTMSDDTFYQYSEYEYVARRFSINVGYRFGKMNTQVKKARRSINNDDRMGGESSGSSSSSN